MIEFYMALVRDNDILLLYMASVFIDVLLGNIAAWTTLKDVDSSVGLRGTIKHLGLFAFVMLFLPVLTLYLKSSAVSIGIVSYLVYQYVISIIENLNALGFDVPPWLADKMRRLKDVDEIDVSDSATVKIQMSKYKNTFREDDVDGKTTEDP